MQCQAITRKGQPCSLAADPGQDLCHVHRPDGKFQQQQARRALDISAAAIDTPGATSTWRAGPPGPRKRSSRWYG